MMSKLPEYMTPIHLAEHLPRDPRLRLLDVRTRPEFALAHVEGSFNVPLHRLEAHLTELRTLDAPVVLVCRSGARALRAAALLRRSGLRNVHLLEGGMLAWQACGLPVRRARVGGGAVLRRAVGVLGVVLGIQVARANPVLGALIALLGVRQAMGLAALPCAAGACARPADDTARAVRALGEPPRDGERTSPATG